MMLIFERSKEGCRNEYLSPCDVPELTLPDELQRGIPLRLPQVSEPELCRHYTCLANQTFGVNDGFYPLGSCTMKYNPKINEKAAAMTGFTKLHPLQPESTVQGALEILAMTEKSLCEITGMDSMTFQPSAGAHGEFTGILMIKAYHHSHNDLKRTKIIVPDSAHGTNPATASMAGFTVVTVPSAPDGCVDTEELKKLVGEDTAGLMLTNPNTLGLFDKNINEITKIIHDAGGLAYYDGANLNAVMGIARPGDMDFDVVHLNLHKTFSTPHGGGGPGSGPVGCKAFLAPFLPGPAVTCNEKGTYEFYFPEHSIGRVKMFYGNFLVILRAAVYLLSTGCDGVKSASENAVLNANYMKACMAEFLDVAHPETCMHEFVLTFKRIKEETGVSAMDFAKALLDHGMHPPTMYFPMIVPEALMIEPTETETKGMMDYTVHIFRDLYEQARTDPEGLHQAPLHTPVRRVNEVEAARNPRLKYSF